MGIKTWWTKITGGANNADQFPVQQIQYMGKTADATVLFPFGLYANIDNDALGFMWVAGNSTENKVMMAYTPQTRPNLEQGEVALYRPQGDAIIKFLNNGNIEITTSADVLVNCANATVTASASVTIDSPTTTLTGNLHVDGNITTDSNITAQGTIEGSIVTDGTIDLGTHTHIGSPTAGTGPVSNTGLPL